MDAAAEQHLEKLLELDARHDDLLRQLDELDQRVEEALRQFQPSATPTAELPQAAAIVDGPDAPTC